MISKKPRPRTGLRPPKGLKPVLEDVETRFVEVMRRPPRSNDRIFYWSYCYSNTEFKEETIRLMLHANIPQHLIYILIRDANLQFDILKKETKGNVYKAADYAGFASDDGPLVQALYILGNFIERNVNSAQYRVDNRRFICAYLVVRAYRIVRAIFRSQRYTTAEESLVLVRSLYEIYCKLCYASRTKANAKYLIDSDFGLTTGEFEIYQENGKFNRRLLVHKRSRETIPRFRSFHEYISRSPFSGDIELFSSLYEYLSSFVHSGSRHMSRAWIDEHAGFSLTEDNDEGLKVLGLMLTTSISAMIMQALLRFRNISSISRWDILLFCRVTRRLIVELGAPDGSEASEIVAKIKARAAVLPNHLGAFKG